MRYEARAVNEALRLANENSHLQYRIDALEAILLDFLDAGAGNSIDFVWHGRAFANARKILGR